MNRNKLRLFTAASLGAGLAVGQIALAKDITIADPKPGNVYGASFGPLEDNEVEPGCTTGQVWDLEAVTLSAGGTKLSVIGGYNMWTGYGGFAPGDIFIDTTPGNNVPAVGGSGAGNSNYANNGWEYVIHFNNFDVGATQADRDAQGLGSGAYSVYKLFTGTTPVGTLRDVYYTQNQFSSPWRYISGGTLVTTGTATLDTILADGWNPANKAAAGFDPLDTTPTGGTHYVLSVNTAWFSSVLPPVSELNGQITMGCGNDVISAYTTGGGLTGPDGGASVILLGMGIIGLFGANRKARA